MGRKDRQRENLKRIAIGSTVAAAAGYLAGVLTAPKSGKQTRADIKSAADSSRVQAEKDLKRLHTELDKVIKDAKAGSGKLSAKAQKELAELVEKAKDTKEKTREVISAIHEGDAEDKDLARAVKNANTALKHLRNYLKK
ncbi:MAG TPA: YtxH domain-containing protein [Candidatus Dormibacteraeota bacterium]|nr:YtxH domain-containing protein [Candidatus Dormibacteraeota bacterium]